MMNILNIVAATKMANSKPVLRDTAVEIDKENLWPIIKEITDFPAHTHFIKVIFIEEQALKLTHWLEGRKFSCVEDKPVICLLIRAALIYMVNLLNESQRLTIYQLPNTSKLFNHHILNYQKQPAGDEILGFDYYKAIAKLTKEVFNPVQLVQLESTLPTENVFEPSLCLVPKVFKNIIRKYSSLNPVSMEELILIACGYYQVIKFIFGIGDEQLKHLISKVDCRFTKGELDIHEIEIHFWNIDQIWVASGDQNIKHDDLLFDFKIMLYLISKYQDGAW